MIVKSKNSAEVVLEILYPLSNLIKFMGDILKMVGLLQNDGLTQEIGVIEALRVGNQSKVLKILINGYIVKLAMRTVVAVYALFILFCTELLIRLGLLGEVALIRVRLHFVVFQRVGIVHLLRYIVGIYIVDARFIH